MNKNKAIGIITEVMDYLIQSGKELDEVRAFEYCYDLLQIKLELQGGDFTE